MAKTNIILNIIGDSSSATKEIHKVKTELSSLSKVSVRGLSSSLLSTFKNIGATGTSIFKKLSSTILSFKTLFISAISGYAIKSAISSFIKASNEMENALAGLKAIAEFKGISFDEVNEAAKRLAADGLMSISEAAQSLKNLLLRGFGLDEAIDIINRFKDAAAFGRQASLDFGEAIVSATEGLKNENSILVDNAGVTKNVAKMWQDYAKRIGKTADQLTLAEKRQAEYNGIMEETEPMLGNAQKLTELWNGKIAKLGVLWTEVKAKLGDAFKEGFKPLLEKAVKGMEILKQWVVDNKDVLVAFFSKLAQKIQEFIVSFIKNIPSMISHLKGIIEAIKGIGTAFDYAKRIGKGAMGVFQTIVGVIQKFISSLAGGLKNIFYGLSLGGRVPILKDVYEWAKEEEELYKKFGDKYITEGIEKVKKAFTSEEVEKKIKIEGMDKLDELIQKLSQISDKDVEVGIHYQQEGGDYGY